VRTWRGAGSVRGCGGRRLAGLYVLAPACGTPSRSARGRCRTARRPRSPRWSGVPRARAPSSAGAAGIAVMAEPSSRAARRRGHGVAIVTRLAALEQHARAGGVSITRPGPRGWPRVSLDRTRRPRLPQGEAQRHHGRVHGRPGGVVVQASGSLSQGLDVEQTAGTICPPRLQQPQHRLLVQRPGRGPPGASRST